MKVLAAVFSLVLIALPLIDAFEAILQPRRVTHRYRYSRLFYHFTWSLWRAIALTLRPGKRREAFLSLFGPLSLFGLMATWVVGLVLGFGMLCWSAQIPLRPANEEATILTYWYMSGITLFTLGYGDVTPISEFGRLMAVIEAGIGFGFLAAIISYLPTLYQAYALREVTISLLDARAGSPPSAAETLRRVAQSRRCEAIHQLLAEWERWSAELLSSHLSFPVLSYYRSQHDNQSWLAALTTMLDVCAILTVKMKNVCSYQAQLTFAMARHAAVDLALVLKLHPVEGNRDRVPSDELAGLLAALRKSGVEIDDDPESDARLRTLCGTYEPFVQALASHALFALPSMIAQLPVVDNWQRSGWMKRAPGIGRLSIPEVDENDHFS